MLEALPIETPENLSYTPDGKTRLTYVSEAGLAQCQVDFPAQLLTHTFDPAPLPLDSFPLANAQAALFACFSAMPLSPRTDWQAPSDALPCFREAFAIILATLRQPAQNRWIVRGEPHHFLIAGHRVSTGWDIGAITVARGKPAVLCIRAEDIIRALPLEHPFATAQFSFQSDGSPAETLDDIPWDTRVRLPIADNGGMVLRIRVTPTATR